VSTKTYLLAYAATAVAFLAFDSIWLSLTARRLYRPLIGHLLADKFSVAPAALFYLLYAAGIVFLAIAPAIGSGRWMMAAASGALLGLVAYGTYDLTNQATLRDWPPAITLADLAWGTALTCVAATIGYFVAQRFATP
jgi:uncharacterized membrane protein